MRGHIFLVYSTVMIVPMRAAALLLLFAFAVGAQPAPKDWQSLKDLSPGTAVRVIAGTRSLSGSLQSVSDDALSVSSDKAHETVMRQEVKRVLVRKKGHRGRNALIGLAAGAGVGAIVGAASHRDCTGFCVLNISRGQDAGIAAGVFGILGAAVGTLLPTGNWREVYRQ